MASNLEKYKNDLDKLIEEGELLKKSLIIEEKTKNKDNIEINYSFKENYQTWYSESLNLVKIILPDRFNDFKKLYEKKNGIEQYLLENDNFILYSIEPSFNQQLNILKSAQKIFESSLFDIKQLLQADLFNSELDAAKELNNSGFVRCGGAIAGVVLEKHLAQVCEDHNIKINKKKPTLSDYYENLKNNKVIDLASYRQIQYLTDIRNKCAHNDKEPTQEEVNDMIEKVEKIIKYVN
jgi:hypothetical protein